MSERRSRQAGIPNVGQRFAPSLGMNDPRMRNPGTEVTNPQLVYEEPIAVNRRGKVSLTVGNGLRVEAGKLTLDVEWLRSRLGL